MKRVRTKRWIAGLLLGVAVGLAGCQDAGTGVDEQIPTGVVLLDTNGNTVASANGSTVSGRIQIRSGVPQAFQVRLIGVGGSELGLGQRYVLQPRIVSSTLGHAVVSGADVVILTGGSTGSTTLILDVMDGSTAVLTPAIPLTIS